MGRSFLLLGLLLFSLKAVAQATALSVGDSLYALGHFSKAINAYAKVGNDRASLQIARAYNSMGSFDKAMLQYSTLLEGTPTMDIARFELGKLCLKTKNYGPAGELFNSLAAKGQGNPEFHYYLGRTLEQIGNRGGANGEFRKAIALDSTHIRSLYSLAKYFTAAGEKDSVLKYVDLGLRVYGEDVSLLHLKAMVYFKNGEFRRAAPLFEHLLALGEDRPFIYKNLAYCNFRNLEPEKAIDNYRLLMGSPDYLAAAYTGLGEVYLKENQLDSAQYYIRKSMEERRVAFDQEYADLGRIARLRGNTKGALDHYTKAWEENPKNHFFYLQVCQLADEHYKDPKIVIRYYEKLLELYPDIPAFMGEQAKKRISGLREEIHYGNP